MFQLIGCVCRGEGSKEWSGISIPGALPSPL